MPILYGTPIQQSTKYVHKFKYTSSTGGDKGTTHTLEHVQAQLCCQPGDATKTVVSNNL